MVSKSSGVAAPIVMSPRAPQVSWVRMWSVALLICTGTLGSAEAYWRANGLRPSVADSKELWHFHRQRVCWSDRKTIVLLGSSRIQAGICQQTLCDLLPDFQVVQLAVKGARSPIGTLFDLAQDDRFRGIVICDVIDPFFSRDQWADQATHYSFRPGFVASCEAMLARLTQGRFALLRWNGSLQALLNGRVRQESLGPHWWISADRTLNYEFAPSDRGVSSTASQRPNARSFQYDEQRILSSADRAEINSAISAIDARGGQVIFIRMPSSGADLVNELSFYPKAECWDRIVAGLSARSIHFMDVPALREFECPDGSHLDHRQSRTFTSALVDELMQRNSLKAGWQQSSR